jgi:hypothetical protein
METKITNKDKKRIFKRAYWMINGGAFDSETLTFGEALKRCWADLKAYKAKLKDQIITECNKLRKMYNVKENEQKQLNISMKLSAEQGTNLNR